MPHFSLSCEAPSSPPSQKQSSRLFKEGLLHRKRLHTAGWEYTYFRLVGAEYVFWLSGSCLPSRPHLISPSPSPPSPFNVFRLLKFAAPKFPKPSTLPAAVYPLNDMVIAEPVADM